MIHLIKNKTFQNLKFTVLNCYCILLQVNKSLKCTNKLVTYIRFCVIINGCMCLIKL